MSSPEPFSEHDRPAPGAADDPSHGSWSSSSPESGAPLEADVWLERWGPDSKGAVYFSIYNSSERELRPALTVRVADLDLKGKTLILSDLLSNGSWQAPIRAGNSTLQLTAPTHQTRVLRLAVQ